MKKFTRCSVILFFILLLSPAGINKARACVDYHTTIWVTCDYDSTYSEIMLTVHNLYLFGSPASVFCSCAINNYTDVFSNIDYVAFVDSGTTNPVAGFAPWTPNSSASASWNNIMAGSWDAFMAGTVGAGLFTGDPVELVIRAALPPGYNAFVLDSNLVISYIGTDEWDNTGDSLALSHNSISSITTGGAITYVEKPMSYFNSIDSIFTVGISEATKTGGIEVYPNPARDMVFIELIDHESDNIELLNLLGQVVRQIPLERTTGKFQVSIGELPAGPYFIRLSGEKKTVVARFIKE